MSEDTVAGRSRILTDFRGDFDVLAQLMQRSWSENRTSSFFYTAEYLKSLFRQPGASYALAPTIYYGSTPVGFVAGFPRTVRYIGHAWKILIITLLTVSPDQKKLGYGVILWSELVKRAQALGFDGMINYCVDGEPMNEMIVGCCRRLQLPVEKVCTVNYLASILWPKPAESQVQVDSLEAIDAFQAAADQVTDSSDIGRRWTAEEVRWMCSREGAVVAQFEAESRWGILSGQIIPLTDENHTSSLLVEDILWGSLESDERTTLARRLMAMAAARGARIASVPMLGYADMEPFLRARFRASTRRLHTYLTLWKGSSQLEKVNSFYLDVF